jgi:hypothetical protein
MGIFEKLKKSLAQNNGDAIIKEKAVYYGGHFLHPINKNVISGIFKITDKAIIFEKKALFDVEWAMTIPLNKILWKKVSQNVGEDIAFKQQMTAASYFAGYAPITSYSRNITFITIPYKDEKGVEQNPRFSFKKGKALQEISKFLYDKIAKK